MAVPTLSPFKLAWVQAFAAVVQFGSENAAAREIGCNQSTVSRAVRDLGHFLGGQLFDRERAMELTPLGSAFLPKALELLDWARHCRGMSARIGPVETVKRPTSNLRSKLAAAWNALSKLGSA